MFQIRMKQRSYLSPSDVQKWIPELLTYELGYSPDVVRRNYPELRDASDTRVLNLVLIGTFAYELAFLAFVQETVNATLSRHNPLDLELDLRVSSNNR